MERGLFSVLMLLAQNLLTRRRRTAATFTLAFPQTQKLKRIVSFLQKEPSLLLKYTRLKPKVSPG